jgi:hypothetical protein
MQNFEKNTNVFKSGAAGVPFLDPSLQPTTHLTCCIWGAKPVSKTSVQSVRCVPLGKVQD